MAEHESPATERNAMTDAEAETARERLESIANGNATQSIAEGVWLAQSALALAKALQRCSDNDLTVYAHHAPRGDGKPPAEATPPGTQWLTPKQIADIALAHRPFLTPTPARATEGVPEVTLVDDGASKTQALYVGGNLTLALNPMTARWALAALNDLGVIKATQRYTDFAGRSMPDLEAGLDELDTTVAEPITFKE